MKSILSVIFMVIFLIIFFKNSAVSQLISCGTPVPATAVNQKENASRTSSVATFSCATVRVYFKFIRHSNGTGGHSHTEIPAMLAAINKTYNAINITIISAGYQYIDDDVLFTDYNFNEGPFPTYGPTHHIVPASGDAINIFVLAHNHPRLGGMAAAIPSADFWVSSNAALTTSTISHELGHCLGLFHTHETNNNGNVVKELVDGSNCDKAGDFICDTPADPNLTYKVDAFCQYIGTELDPSKKVYHPDPTNIMSYASEDCRTRFSEGQKARIFDEAGYRLSVTNCVSAVQLEIALWKGGNASTRSFIQNLYSGEVFEQTALPNTINFFVTATNMIGNNYDQVQFILYLPNGQTRGILETPPGGGTLTFAALGLDGTVPPDLGQYRLTAKVYRSGILESQRDVSFQIVSTCNFSITADASNASPGCGGATTLRTTCSGTNCGDLTYLWTGNGLNQYGSSVNINASSNNGSYTYTVTASKAGCNSISTNVTVAVTGCGSTPTPTNTDYRGYLDVADCNTLAGWAFDNNRNQQSASVDVYLNGQKAATLLANQSRQDVANAYGISGYNQYGFSWSIPDQYKNGSALNISVRYVGTTTNVSLSPKTTPACPGSGTPPTPPPPSGNCAFSEGQYMFTFNGNETIYAHYYNGVLFAAYQNPTGNYKPRTWLVAAGYDATQATCFAQNDPRTATTPTPTPTPTPTGQCAAFTNGKVVAHRTDIPSIQIVVGDNGTCRQAVWNTGGVIHPDWINGNYFTPEPGFTIDNIKYCLAFEGEACKRPASVTPALQTASSLHTTNANTELAPARISTAPQTPSTDELLAYPNPVADVLTVQLARPLSTEPTFTLTDMAGRTQAVLPYLTIVNSQRVQLSVRHLTTGQYILRIGAVRGFGDAGKPQTVKFVKQ